MKSKDVLIAIGLGCFVSSLLVLFRYPIATPAVWQPMSEAIGLIPPDDPMPGLWRMIVAGLASWVGVGSIDAALVWCGNVALGICTACIYLTFGNVILPLEQLSLRRRVNWSRHVLYILSGIGTLLVAFSEPMWQRGQTFLPETLELLITLPVVLLFVMFLRTGSHTKITPPIRHFCARHFAVLRTVARLASHVPHRNRTTARAARWSAPTTHAPVPHRNRTASTTARGLPCSVSLPRSLTSHTECVTMHSFLKPERPNAMTTTFTMRIDDALKGEAEDVFEDIGLNLSSAITCFLKKCVAVGGMPFQLVRQSKHDMLRDCLREAEEAANDPNEPRCTDPTKLREFLLQ